MTWLRTRFAPVGQAGHLLRLTDVVALSASFLLATFLRFEFSFPPDVRNHSILYLAIVIAARLAALSYAGTYRSIPRYAGTNDLVRIVIAQAASTVAAAALGQLLGVALDIGRIPLAILAIDFFVGTAFVGGIRMVLRLLANQRAPEGEERRLLIVGAGDGGSLVAKHFRANPKLGRRVIGFVDDDPKKQRRDLDGIPIVGSTDDVGELIDQLSVEEVIFGIPSAPGHVLRKVLYACGGRVSFRTVPTLLEFGAHGDSPTDLRNVRVEDLLRREPVQLELESVRKFIAGRRVLVTGGGGSIGAELCRQVAAIDPARLIVYERYENNLYEIDRDLRERLPGLKIVPVVGDINDRRLLEHVMKNEHPNVVFHAAAHKHVPLMEANVPEAVRNNVFGTLNLVEAADRHGVEEFVMVSTDKAVRPTSVMGATKRIAEKIVQSRAGLSATHFITVRFGNVLNSAGSVIPLFRRQIESGGPVTITHPEVRRYFMTIREASQLVVQAGALGRGAEVFVLDMGDPIRIVDLARDMIMLTGRRPGVDIELRFVGLRPGEKLFEELLDEDGEVQPTRHPKIMIARTAAVDSERLTERLDALAASLENQDSRETSRLLWQTVEEHSPSAAAPGE